MTAEADLRVRRAMPEDPAPRPSSRLLRRIAGDRAEERILRVLAFGFLPAAALFGVLAGPAIAAQAGHWPVWWNVLAVCGTVLPAAAFGVCAFVAPLGALRGAAGVCAGATLVVEASVPLVVSDPAGIGGQGWFTTVVALGLIASVIAVGPGTAALVAIVGSVLCGVDRLATDPAAGLVGGLQDGLYVQLFAVTFIALGASARAAARAADAAESDALAAAAGIATAAARERERTRINDLVHDRVLATLLAAARPLPDAAALTRHDAARALEDLHALLRDAPVGDRTVDPLEFVWTVQSATTQLVPDALFVHEVDLVRTGDHGLPEPATEALLAAAEEALRNSRRHAGPGANRTVHVQIDGAGARIEVLDDGVGFERVDVPLGRLGISDSIEGRMRGLQGGSARVIASRGVGTRVQLTWRRP